MWFMKNILFEQKNTKLLNKWHFVGNKNRACAACLKMQHISLLPKYIYNESLPGAFFYMSLHMPPISWQQL
jgi:hypothetical protein